MEALSTLEAMGLVLPTPAYIFGAIVFGIVGMVAFYRGRKAALPAPKWIGVALMFYPYAVEATWLLYVVGIALCGGLFFYWNGSPGE